MARSMLKMSKGGFIVFSEIGNDSVLKNIRKSDRRFKRARISSVLQFRPDLTPEGLVLVEGEKCTPAGVAS